LLYIAPSTAFAKLSNDFKGLNGQNINNTFVFNQTATSSGGASIKFNDPYTYIANNKYSIGYADESMLQVGLMRNRILTKYNVVHAVDEDSNLLVMTLIADDDDLTYAVDGAIYSNAQSPWRYA
jgi:hypothetical protein